MSTIIGQRIQVLCNISAHNGIQLQLALDNGPDFIKEDFSVFTQHYFMWPQLD